MLSFSTSSWHIMNFFIFLKYDHVLRQNIACSFLIRNLHSHLPLVATFCHLFCQWLWFCLHWLAISGHHSIWTHLSQKLTIHIASIKYSPWKILLVCFGIHSCSAEPMEMHTCRGKPLDICCGRLDRLETHTCRADFIRSILKAAALPPTSKIGN